MQLWHLTSDAPRSPRRVSPSEPVTLQFGTWPIEPGQSVWVTYRVQRPDRVSDEGRVEAAWGHNEGPNSYWRAAFGPFAKGEQVTYVVQGRSPAGEIVGPTASFRVGPELYLALVWHQHQPVYKDTAHTTPAGSYLHPWVRLHAIRDYYSMAALVSEHPNVHLTINLTPVLIWQVEDYLAHGATDRALELTLKRAETLTTGERQHILSTFFDADWHNQIFPHRRYKELFVRRREGRRFAAQDVRDVQMWFNLAWFGQEFRDGEVALVTGETASVRRFVEKGRDFTVSDIQALVAEQYKIMRAILPLHRQLQERGQVEISTTPFYHPILPLLINTDGATIDRPGAMPPARFAHPEDAEAQVRLAVEWYQHHFGRLPRGMWPAEGAVSQAAIPFFARHGVRWLATDRGVLRRSGRWGYNVDDPNVLCQPYRTEAADHALSLFFRDTPLSDAIGFHYQLYGDYEQAALAFLGEIKERFVRRVTGDDDRVLPVVLDGENAWGAYRQDARPFLHALYTVLEGDPEVETVTFAEYLDGNPARGLASHPPEAQAQVYDLFAGSWIDENGSAPGVDLGTWIGEAEENQAWVLLGQAREFLVASGATPQSAPAAFEALYVAEGSDWFWWFGGDQDSGNDAEFDDLFRLHLKNVYRALGADPPPALHENIVPHTVVWRFTRPAKSVQPRDRLTVRTNCPGVITWHLDDGQPQSSNLAPVGGVMAGVQRFQLNLGPFPPAARAVRFSFHCTQRDCQGTDICCQSDEHTVLIALGNPPAR